MCWVLRHLKGNGKISISADLVHPEPADPEIAKRQELSAKLRAQGDPISVVLGDVVDFHRRELGQEAPVCILSLCSSYGE